MFSIIEINFKKPHLQLTLGAERILAMHTRQQNLFLFFRLERDDGRRLWFHMPMHFALKLRRG